MPLYVVRFVNLFANFCCVLYLHPIHMDSLILCFSENGKSLHVLNLEGCRGLVLDRHQFNANLASYQVANYQLQPIQPIIRKCTELVEVNFGSTGLSYNSISFLADNLTKKVTKRFLVKSFIFLFWRCNITGAKKIDRARKKIRST